MLTRRFSTARTLALVGIFAAAAAFSFSPRSAWSADPQVAAPPASRPATTRPADVPIIELRGDPAEIGKAEGEKLGDAIRVLQRDYLDKFLAMRSENADRDALQALVAAFEPQIRPEHLEEIGAMAAAAGMERRDALLAQCFVDMVLAGGCSTITLPAAASSDHVARFGRNLDFLAMDILDRNTVVLIVHPKGRYAFASVTYPGLIGVLSGMNEHGLTVANMEVARRRRAPDGMPYMLLYRSLLERCKTVKEALALLEKTPRQSANNLMLMDASGDRAVAEITPEKVTVRRAPDTAALISTNHQRGEDLDSPDRCRRYDYLHAAAARDFGKISEKSVEEMLARAAQQKMTIQSMVFEPANRVMYLAVGVNAANHRFVRIDLRPRFR